MAALCFGKVNVHDVGSSFGGVAEPGVVDQDPSHQSAGQGEEVTAVLEGLLAVDKPNEGFVHQRGRLQDVPLRFAFHVAAGDPP